MGKREEDIGKRIRKEFRQLSKFLYPLFFLHDGTSRVVNGLKE